MQKKNLKQIRQALKDKKTLAQCARNFNVVGDLTRLKICYLLCCHKELSVGEIADIVGVSISAVSHTLKKLQKADLVEKSRRSHRYVYYQLKKSPFTNILRKSISIH